MDILFGKSVFIFFYFKNSSKHQESAKKTLMDMHSKKIVSFSDNIDEQFKQSAAYVAVVASNPAIDDNEPKEAEMPPPPNKWFRSLSYDHANDQSLKEEEIRNHDLPEAKTKPNESTPKQNSNSMKSPVSMASKYQSVLSMNNQDKNLDADKKSKCKQQNRRSTSLDWSSRKKLNQNNKNNLASKVASSAKITVCKNSESEENPAFYRLQNDNNNNSKLNTSRASQSSKIFNLDAVKNVLLSAKSKALNLSINNTSNTSYKERVLNNSILNNIKSSLNKSPNKAQDEELQQTLLDNVEIKREESGEQILPQSKE